MAGPWEESRTWEQTQAAWGHSEAFSVPKLSYYFFFFFPVWPELSSSGRLE